MSYIVLTGALKNVGDYLIAERAKNLLKFYRPDRKIIEMSRYEELDSKLDIINNSKAIILAGGPGYMPNMYPEVFKLTKNLDDIKVPIISLGMGWYGSPGDDRNVYEYKYTDKSRELLSRISKDSKYMGCRDYLTSRTLKNNGYSNTLMTGCPAWYDVNFIDNGKPISSKVESVVFSTPASKKFAKQSVDAMKLVKEKYKNAKLYCAFHRGINVDNYTNDDDAKNMEYMKKGAIDLGYEVLDLSYDLDKMKIYDECDLHIGYRVHAHIYCLSHKKKTILIEEDGRARGVNEAVGLYSIKGQKRKFNLFKNNFNLESSNKLFKLLNLVEANGHTINNLSNYIDELEQNDYRILEGGLLNIKNSKENMIEFLKALP